MTRAYRSFICTTLALLAVVAMTACGLKNAPQAPIKQIIPPVTDLKAELSGADVGLSWTPMLEYSTGEPVQVQRIEILRLTEDLNEAMKDFLEREKEMEEANKSAGVSYSGTSNDKYFSELSLQLRKLSQIPPKEFERNAITVKSIPVEQLVEMAGGGKLYYRDIFSLQVEALPHNRVTYAVRTVDVDGRKSALSNYSFVYPLATPAGPTDLTSLSSPGKITLTWAAPERPAGMAREAILTGYNIYKSVEGELESPAPVEPSPIAPPPPVGWNVSNVISHQQIAGSGSRYAWLFSTNDAAEAASVGQVIYDAAIVDQHIGEDLDISFTMSTTGGLSDARIVMDATTDPATGEKAAGSDIFRADENPLILTKDIVLSDNPTEFTFSVKVPVGAKALVFTIEPRKRAPIAKSFILENAAVKLRGQDMNLLENGDLSGFAALAYIETTTTYGFSAKYKVTAEYMYRGMYFESAPSNELDFTYTDSFAPDAPGDVRAQATFDFISITWRAARASDIDGYVVYRREAGKDNWRKLTARPIKQTVYRDNDVKPDIEYEYKVEAVDKAGNVSPTQAVVSAKLLSR